MNEDPQWDSIEQKGVDLEIDAAFFYAVVDSIDFERIDSLRIVLADWREFVVEKKFALSPIGSEGYPTEWVGTVGLLELNQVGENYLLRVLSGLSAADQPTALEQLRNLAAQYQAFKLYFSHFAAMLLYYTPPGAFALFTEFKEKFLQGVMLQKDELWEWWAAILRFVGQAVIGRDGEVRDLAISWFSSQSFGQRLLGTRFNRLLFLALVYAAWFDFKILNGEFQERLCQHLIWRAISLGVPVETLLKEKLAEEPQANQYVYFSGLFAENLLKNDEVIFFSGSQTMTISAFLQAYLSQAKDKDLDPTSQQSYVKKVMTGHGWPAEARRYLERILDIYLHLRECDLIDYRGFLTEEGGRREPYDWKALMQRDLTAVEKDRVKEYFKLLQRPTRLKIELVLAFESVSWQKEPYLSRVLALNEIYDDVYDLPYSPLIYFDEPGRIWKLRKEIPKAW
ncbi:MAG: hypothetical protein HYV42_02195 [Candidatus Magasanikbacteria bacterium]|nr:hypothetical protein [Candidatus Magasanikbacteria bacterium]